MAKRFRSTESRGTIAGQLAILFNRLDLDRININLFLPLVFAVVKKVSDIEVWKLVLQLVDSASRIIPPLSQPSFGGTPRS